MNVPVLAPNAANEQGQSRNAALLFGTLVGGALILNSYLASLIYEAHLAHSERIITGLSALLGALLLAAPIVLRTLRAVTRGERDLGELATLAIFACFAVGQYQEAGLVAFLLMLAQLLEDRTALGARAAVEGLIQLTPNTVHQLEKAGEREVAVSSLAPGDLIRIRPGENVAVDGVIRRGETTLNQASITGESLPVDVKVGDPVFAGTVNLTGLVEVEVSKTGGDTTLGRVRDMILEAERTRLPILRLIDRHIEWYTPAMVMVAAVIFYFTKDIQNAITALVVACPIALVLATPTAMVAGLTAAARFGILIKNVAHLESAGQITAMVFDKTGTLTTGQLTVNRLSPIEGVDAASFLRLAASADRYSNHPAARALVAIAEEAKVPLVETESLTEVGGKGVEAKVLEHDVRVGRRSWLVECGVDMSGVAAPDQAESEGYSYLYVAQDERCIGWASMVDRPRPEALAAVSALKEAGVANLTMLTGDRWAVARRVAASLGCTEVVAECLPHQKLELVEEMKAKGWTVCVVGDGVNDAPALAAGHLGIAMGAAGNDVAIHSASIALMSNELNRLPLLVRLSRRVRASVVQNLGFGILLMVVGLVLSGLGMLSPVIAAAFQNFGGLVVIFNSARIVRFGEDFALLSAEVAI